MHIDQGTILYIKKAGIAIDNGVIYDTIIVMTEEKALQLLTSEKNVKFKTLLKICTCFFKGPRIEGSHYIFKTPWKGQPWVNIQRDKKMAKIYQVRQVREALKKLKAMKTRGKK